MDTDIQENNTISSVSNDNRAHLKPYQWKKGQSGNPLGRPKSKTLKEWSREFLERMTDDERDTFLEGIPKEVIWRMAEGNPTEDKNIKVSVPTPILGGITQSSDTYMQAQTAHNALNSEQVGGILSDELVQELIENESETLPPMPKSEA